MPVSFRSELLTSFILTMIFKQWNILPLVWENTKVIHACTEKNEFVEKVCPADSAWFIYVSTHCVETVKYM